MTDGDREEAAGLQDKLLALGFIVPPTPEDRKLCDVCSKPLSAHNCVVGIPICPGIYAPGFRTSLNDRIRELTRQLAAAEVDADRLAEALGWVMIGGNHLALLIGADHPPYTASATEGLSHYGAGDAYETWLCWRSIVQARGALTAHQARKEALQ